MRNHSYLDISPTPAIRPPFSPVGVGSGFISPKKEELLALKERINNRKKNNGKENGAMSKSYIFSGQKNFSSLQNSPKRSFLSSKFSPGSTFAKPETDYCKQETNEFNPKDFKGSSLFKEKQQLENFVLCPQPCENDTPAPLKLEDFQIGDLLGKGASAKVHLAVHKKTNFLVSIKTISRQKIEEKFDKFLQSLKIQFFLDHPNIVKIYGLIVQTKEVHIVMELCTDRDMSFNRKQFENQSLQTKQCLLDITKSIHYLHKNRIQHRDLKLENIMMSLSVPKITDFELAVYTKLPFVQRRTMCGSPAYFSPEMVEKHKYNKKADIWCLGIIFYELLCGYFPFDLQTIEDINNIAKKDILPMPQRISSECSSLISSMLNKESQQRVDVMSVICHKFFKEVEHGHQDDKKQSDSSSSGSDTQ